MFGIAAALRWPADAGRLEREPARGGAVCGRAADAGRCRVFFVKTVSSDSLKQGLRVEFSETEGLFCKNANDVRQKPNSLYY